MFNKKPRRNFRKRVNESSEEEEQVHDEEGACGLRQRNLPQSRGISCSSKREVGASESASGGAEDAVGSSETAAERKPSPNAWKKENQEKSVLSFSDEKEVDGSEFKVKKSADREVVFKARRKGVSPAELTAVKDQKDADPASASPDPASVSPDPASVSPDPASVSSDEPESGEDAAEVDIHAGSDGDASSTSSSSRASGPRIGAIPDARQIRAARRQRREARAQRDYIPLDQGRDSTPGAGEEEEEEDRSEDSDGTDDHQRRIQFAPRPKTLRERITEKIGGSESEGSLSDSQEDADRNLWEEQQIGKGVKRLQHSGSSSPQETVKHRKKFEIPESLPPVSIAVIKKRVATKLESLREVHRAREAEHRRMQLDMDDAQAALEQLENGSAHEQHRFYRDMRVYIQNLIECLREKVVQINAVELDMHSLLSDQAEALLARRREAVREESSRLQQLAYNTDPSSNGHGEKAQAEAQGARQPGDSDEAEAGGGAADQQPLPEEEEELDRKRDEILRRAEDIFVDVQESFSDVGKILSRFEEWRSQFSESYHNAYISLCLPKLLAPLLRHQLVGWNPLKEDSTDFEALPWYSAADRFCHGQGYEESENTDSKTLTSIIEKTIVTKIQGFVEMVWDPLSSAQSRCLAKLCRRLQDDYSVFEGEQSKPVKAFVEAVVARMRSAVDEDVFIPLYPKRFLDDTRSPQYLFRDRQFYSAVKLLGSIALWDGLVPEDVLKELSLDKLLNRYLMMTLLNTPSEKDSVEKCKKVAACFPKSWFEDVSSRSPTPQLQNFSNHLLQTAHSLCKKNPDITSVRDVVTDVLILLRNIRALDSVSDIVEKYHLKGLEGLAVS
ncbi:GC-rich sequence DNA-binding factor 2 [Megalops cyprinoides]|uniref:GC-rich sequence DNA-binding factor 2 n=1 Tax=Megalops cyprinoides TaxID=118141 RepID=UPI00186525BD|nr:GC-rich sequence DNA-binding factor 2 [Megalops cyprinoides]